MTAAVAVVGHNNPPSDVEVLLDKLNTAYADLAKRTDDLIAGVARVPPEITDDENERKATSFVKQLNDHIKLAKSTKVIAKAPHDEAVKAVDGFFNNIVKPTEAGKDAVLKKLTAYQVKKADAERATRIAAEAKAREEAERAAATLTTEADLETAIEKEEAAVAATVSAQASTADLSRARGVAGGTSSLRTTWTFEVTELGAIPRVYLLVDKAGLDRAIKAAPRNDAGEPVLTIPGIRIVPIRKTVVSGH